MKTEEILSTGIDIGTSTTQLIISSLTLEADEGFGKIPEIKIKNRNVIYKSKIYFTPLLSEREIDSPAVLEILKNEYKAAGFLPSDFKTGAVIITGETSRKDNAREVADAIQDLSGEFVTAICGPDLEGVLAGKGSGAALLSEKEGLKVLNLDIGGGTTNLCLFENGEVIDTACLDLGGRLIKICNGKISYTAEKIKRLTSLKKGDEVSLDELFSLTEKMAGLVFQAAGICPESSDLDFFKTNRLLSCKMPADVYVFSGGVGGCMSEEEISDNKDLSEQTKDIFRYGDIGVLLAWQLNKYLKLNNIKAVTSDQARRATVIGAGNYAVNLSGSTVEYTKGSLPLKNVPVAKIRLKEEADMDALAKNIHNALSLLEGHFPCALSMEGFKYPSFIQIEKTAECIYVQINIDYPAGAPLILIFENDMAKALGQSLKRRIKSERPLICLDGIKCENGDYIDLAEPVASGRAVPVTVKTLVFTV